VSVDQVGADGGTDAFMETDPLHVVSVDQVGADGGTPDNGPKD